MLRHQLNFKSGISGFILSHAKIWNFNPQYLPSYRLRQRHWFYFCSSARLLNSSSFLLISAVLSWMSDAAFLMDWLWAMASPSRKGKDLVVKLQSYQNLKYKPFFMLCRHNIEGLSFSKRELYCIAKYLAAKYFILKYEVPLWAFHQHFPSSWVPQRPSI